MRGFLAILVWWCATAVSTAATVEVAGGPWMLLTEDGGVTVVLETARPVSADAARFLAWRRDGGDDLAPTAVGIAERPRQPNTGVVSWALPAGWTPGERYAIRSHGLPIADGVLPVQPGLDDPARVVIAGANWPDAAQMAAVGTRLGAPPQVVVLLGDGFARGFGRGGWERAIPIVAVGIDTRIPGARLLPGAAGGWRRGLRWGVLGLPAARAATGQALDLARDLSPWQVCLATDAPWDLSLAADPKRADPAGLAPILAVAGRQRVPLILAAGMGGGFISEPLSADGGGAVAGAVSGPRYALATPAGDGLALMPPAAAVAIDGRALFALAADAGAMRLIVEPEDGARERQTLHWRLGADGHPREALAGADAGRVIERWRGGDRDALPLLSWLPPAAIGGIAPTSAEVKALIDAAATDADAARLLRRLGQRDTTFLNGAGIDIAELPPWLGRDLVLRQIAAGGALDDGPAQAMARRSRDPMTVRALLAADRRATDPGAALAPIIARLRRQAAGELPLDDDPLLQHGLASAVFDAPYLSPTGLRPLALDLRDKLDPYARGPVERFIARNGEERGADR